MHYVCVYLGANIGNKPIFKKMAILLGKQIAELGYTLVYGGSSLGTMGILAKTVKENGGQVIGIITKTLIKKEKPLDSLDELIVVNSMQERKLLMQKKADAFIVMPGGLGVLEEAIETWNAIKIGEINKPIGFLNIEDYFNKLFSFIDDCVSYDFLKVQQSKVPYISKNPIDLLNLTVTSDKSGTVR